MTENAKCAWLLAAFLSVGVLLPPNTAFADGGNAVREEVAAVLQGEGLVGAAWTLIRPGLAGEVGAAGFSDNLEKTPFTAGTRFHVGSVSKAVLATGVLRLATQGTIDLDEPVSSYLPNVAISNPWRDDAPVTVRHLLDHTSGLDDARLWQLFSQRPTPDTPLSAAFPQTDNLLRARSRPGSRFSYSNMGYGLLGALIEEVTGERYESYLDEKLLMPLGMAESTFAFTTQEGSGADPTLAWGHVDDGGRFPAAPVFLRPAAQFTTTAADLGRFAEFLMSDGSIDGREFVGAELMAARGRPVGTLAANGGLVAGYALGLGRRDRHGVVGYCHAGSIVGFSAMLCVYPTEKKAFAYAVNTDSETADYGRIAEALIAALDLEVADAPASVEAAQDRDAWEGFYVPRPNRFSAFVYLDTLFGARRVGVVGENVVLAPTLGVGRVLRPTGPRLYSADDRATTSHVLHRGDNGEYLYSDGFGSYERISSAFIALLWLGFVVGFGGVAWLLFAGVVLLARGRRNALSHPVMPAFFAISGLLVPVPLFFSQSFMALGDPTAGAVTLALVTAVLPLAACWTLLKAVRRKKASRGSAVHGIAALAMLQWCVTLFAYGMLPLTLWT